SDDDLELCRVCPGNHRSAAQRHTHHAGCYHAGSGDSAVHLALLAAARGGSSITRYIATAIEHDSAEGNLRLPAAECQLATGHSERSRNHTGDSDIAQRAAAHRQRPGDSAIWIQPSDAGAGQLRQLRLLTRKPARHRSFLDARLRGRDADSLAKRVTRLRLS